MLKVEIKIKKVGEMIDEKEELKFSTRAELIQSFYVSFDKKYMLLGYIKDDEITFIPKDQDVNNPILLSKEDSFIFIKY